ncbi:MAG: toll/interleukin-1 receptor domain-containing protein [Saprospiraceae bacterium]
MKYKAFISYRHSENGRRHAVALETALKRYAKPTLARPMKIFRDEKHMKPDISLPKLIREGLENSEYLIFLAEKASAESQWCGEELEYWCGTLQRTENLIIILVEDDIVLNRTQGINFEQTTALPVLLQPYLTSIPLYVDLRWAKNSSDTDLENPRYRQEINALSARLRGLNPEDLNDQEIRVYRRNIRLRNGALGVLLAMLVIAVGAAWWALDAQKKAEVSAVEAKKQQQIAEANAIEARKNLADRIEQERQKERLNFEKFVNNGDVLANSGDFKIALRYYQKADSILIKFPDDAKLIEKKEILLQKIKNATGKTAFPR